MLTVSDIGSNATGALNFYSIIEWSDLESRSMNKYVEALHVSVRRGFSLFLSFFTGHVFLFSFYINIDMYVLLNTQHPLIMHQLLKHHY